MAKNQFQGMGKQELQQKIVELRKELMKKSAELSTKTASKSIGQIHKMKKSIAQIKTQLNKLQRDEAIASIKKQEEAKKDE